MKGTSKFFTAVAAVFLFYSQAKCEIVQGAAVIVNNTAILFSEYFAAVKVNIAREAQENPKILKDDRKMLEIEKDTLRQLEDDALIREHAQSSGIKIRDRQVDVEIDRIKRNFNKDAQGNVLTAAERDALFGKELKEQGLSLEKFRENTRSVMAAKKYVSMHYSEKMKVSEQETKDLFQKLETAIKTPALVADEEIKTMAQQMKIAFEEKAQVAHILFAVKSGASVVEKNEIRLKALKVRKKIKTAEDFIEQAKLSDDTATAQNGGMLGVVVKGKLPPELDKAVFTLDVGEVSQPVLSQYGYHLLRVQKKIAREPIAYSKVKDQIARYLSEHKLQTELKNLTAELRKKASITVASEITDAFKNAELPA